MAVKLEVASFLDPSSRIPIIDVRAPAEFASGHIPGAINIPLFSDEERKEVGTAYKQVNREAAMYIGLEHVGKKLVQLAKAGERAAGPGKKLRVHCWRGGMRSHSMAWLFETMGIGCELLEGGYKAYRHFALKSFDTRLKLLVVGGRTGSGKTDILQRLGEAGEQVIDLEGLAHHKGSAFGALGELPQPSTEQFENDLCQKIMTINPEKEVWIEDESRNVGRCVIPAGLYEQMKSGRLLFLDIDRDLRSEHLVGHYASYAKEELKSCILKISKRLGGDRTREALESVDREAFRETAMITLQYYDKAYMYSLEKNHDAVEKLQTESIDPAVNAKLLMDYVGK